MTAKYYLCQARRLDESIKTKKMELEQLRQLSHSISVPLSTGNRVRPSSVSDKICKTISKIVDLENEIDTEICDLVDLKCEIREQINAVAHDDLCLILIKYYINLISLEEIAVDMGYTYRHTTRLHGKAIEAFQKIFKGCP